MKRKYGNLICWICCAAATLLLFASCSCNPFDPKQSPPTPVHLVEESQAETNPIRPIDSREQRLVEGATLPERQANLLGIVTDGFKPTFDESSRDVEEIYNAAIAVLDRYILNDFTEYERVHAVHDYLCAHVGYDDELYRRYLDGDSALGSNDSFHLSGVFLKGKAVCDGISKAFTLLCAIEDIDSARIVGEYWGSDGAVAHAWNKVKVDGNWYNVDATLDRARIDAGGKTQSLVHHGFFLISDSEMENSVYGRHVPINDLELNPSNEATPKEGYPVYENLYIEIGGARYDALITSEEQLTELAVAVRKAKRKVGKLDIKLRIEGVEPNKVGAYDYYIGKALEQVKNTDFEFTPIMSVRPYTQYPDGAMLLYIYI